MAPDNTTTARATEHRHQDDGSAASPPRRRAVEARLPMVMVTTVSELDMSAWLDLRARYGRGFEERHGVRLGITSGFIKAAAAALRSAPGVLDDAGSIDVGIAIHSEHGTVVPRLRDAETLSFAQIERGIADLAARADRKELGVEELQAGALTIIDRGESGALLSTAHFPGSQTPTLTLFAIQERAAARDGASVVRPMMYVTFTHDERAGRDVARFLQAVKTAIESPASLMLGG